MRSLLLIILVSLGCPTLGQASNPLCPSARARVNTVVASRLSALKAKAVDRESSQKLFVGLYSELDESSHQDLSIALKQSDPHKLAAGVKAVQERLKARMQADRSRLVSWSQRQGVAIEVEDEPVDGSFIFVHASQDQLTSILCASAQNDLPAVYSSLAN